MSTSLSLDELIDIEHEEELNFLGDRYKYRGVFPFHRRFFWFFTKRYFDKHRCFYRDDLTFEEYLSARAKDYVTEYYKGCAFREGDYYEC